LSYKQTILYNTAYTPFKESFNATNELYFKLMLGNMEVKKKIESDKLGLATT